MAIRQFEIKGDVMRTLEVGDNGHVATVALTRGLRHIAVTQASEIALVLDRSTWRHDVDAWRFQTASDGDPASWHDEDLNDDSWLKVMHLQPLIYTSFDGRACFRHRFHLNAAHAGEVVTFVLGGFDDEDWLKYNVYVNGRAVDQWSTARGWHRPREVRVTQVNDAYTALRFGDVNLLTVEVAGLDRPRDAIHQGEEDRHIFQSLLLDQFVVVGEPYEVVNDFVVVGVAQPSDDRLSVELDARHRPGLSVTLEYHGGDVGRKQATIRNKTTEALVLLDVVLEDLEVADECSAGGNGMPVVGRQIFAGLEFPAAMNQGQGSLVRIIQMPGTDVAAGASFTTETAVVGMARDDESVQEAFRRYLRSLRPRTTTRKAIYSALGWYDFTNPADPLFELDEKLVDENLEQLADLGSVDARFDVYMFDDWWDPADPLSFRKTTFPQGARATGELVRESGMMTGLWVAPITFHWGWRNAPGIELAVIGGHDPDEVRELLGATELTTLTAGGESVDANSESVEPGFDEEFGLALASAPRLCMAAEPLRSILGEALPHHARTLELACLKVDGVFTHCTASHHGHRPTRYSFEAGSRALLDAVRAAEEARPGLYVIWYWGARSPWWLKFGDALWDTNLKLEGASPATEPSYFPRQAVSLSVDQALQHAALIPLDLRDSLGVWIGDVAWTNRLGRRGWRDALILDIARGSALIQLWGDLTLFDEPDKRFLATALAWGTADGQRFLETSRVGGDPWNAEVYGYTWPTKHGQTLVLHNPSLFGRTFDLPAAEDRATHVVELFPFPGATTVGVDGGRRTIELRPYEVRALQFLDGPRRIKAQHRPATTPTIPLDVDDLSWSERGNTVVGAGSVGMPAVRRGDVVLVIVQLARNGASWFDRALHRKVNLVATLRGRDVWYDAEPRARTNNGPGYSWVVYRLPCGPSWSQRTLRLWFEVDLPSDVQVEITAVLLHPWWDAHEGDLATLDDLT